MENLHSLNFVHRYLKTKHILLDSELHPILTDFGVYQLQEWEITSPTPYIMVPELLDDYIQYKRTKPIDVYSFSMILYEIWTETFPHENLNLLDIVQKVLNNIRPHLPSYMNNIKNLITRFWDQNPDERPTFTEICDFLETNGLIPSMDQELFNSYKQLVRPSHPSEASNS